MPQPQLADVLLDGDEYNLQQGSKIVKFDTSCSKLAFEVADFEVHKEVMTEKDSQLDPWLHDDSNAFLYMLLVLEIHHKITIHDLKLLNKSMKSFGEELSKSMTQNLIDRLLILVDALSWTEILSWVGIPWMEILSWEKISSVDNANC